METFKIIRSKRKTLALQIKNGELIVRAPLFIFRSTIDRFIEKHESWIQKKLQTCKKRRIFSEEEKKSLKIKAKKYIPNRVKELASEHWFEYNNIRITGAEWRWGSCSSKRNLSFSFRLILTPLEVIDYVIIHELSHLKHMNHSRAFWNEVRSMMSDYKEKEKWLKVHGASLSFTFFDSSQGM